MVQISTLGGNRTTSAWYYCSSINAPPQDDAVRDLEWGESTGGSSSNSSSHSSSSGGGGGGGGGGGPSEEPFQENSNDDDKEEEQQELDEEQEQEPRFYNNAWQPQTQTQTQPQRQTQTQTQTTPCDYQFRRIQPTDRQRIQELHETWFPVQYQAEFYDELVHGKMCRSGEDLYTNLVVSQEDPFEIRACLVAAVVPSTRLNKATRRLILPDPQQHARACYIMTLGTVHEHRQAGLATQLIQQCFQEVVERDTGCGALYLHVITSNPQAIRFYERLGFWKVQEIPDYYHIDEQYHNCYLYAKYFHGKNRYRMGGW